MGSSAFSNEQIDLDWKPKVRDDIYFNDLFSTGNDGHYIVGSLNNDSQVLIHSDKITVFQNLLKVLNGKNTVSELCKNGYGEIEELNKVIKLCYDKGLLTECDEIKKFNEAENISVKLFRHDFKEFSASAHNISKIAVLAFRVLFLFVFVATVYIVFKHLSCITKLTIRTAISFRGKEWFNVVLGYILIQLLTLLMGVVHEIAHAVVSLKNDCQPKYISFVLYLGFMPMAYVKQKSIYSIKKEKILEILFAGVIMNFFAFMIFTDAFIYTNSNMCKLLAITNIHLALINLVPFSLTDGYYIFSILFKKPNLRMNFFRFLAYPKEIKKFDLNIRVCYIIFLATIIICLNIEVVVLMNVISSRLGGGFYLLLIPLNIIYLLVLHEINKKKFLNMQKNMRVRL
jgi:hypothetical protein